MANTISLKLYNPVAINFFILNQLKMGCLIVPDTATKKIVVPDNENEFVKEIEMQVVNYYRVIFPIENALKLQNQIIVNAFLREYDLTDYQRGKPDRIAAIQAELRETWKTVLGF